MTRTLGALVALGLWAGAAQASFFFPTAVLPGARSGEAFVAYGVYGRNNGGGAYWPGQDPELDEIRGGVFRARRDEKGIWRRLTRGRGHGQRYATTITRTEPYDGVFFEQRHTAVRDLAAGANDSLYALCIQPDEAAPLVSVARLSWTDGSPLGWPTNRPRTDNPLIADSWTGEERIFDAAFGARELSAPLYVGAVTREQGVHGISRFRLGTLDETTGRIHWLVVTDLTFRHRGKASTENDWAGIRRPTPKFGHIDLGVRLPPVERVDTPRHSDLILDASRFPHDGTVQELAARALLEHQPEDGSFFDGYRILSLYARHSSALVLLDDAGRGSQRLLRISGFETEKTKSHVKVEVLPVPTRFGWHEFHPAVDYQFLEFSYADVPHAAYPRFRHRQPGIDLGGTLYQGYPLDAQQLSSTGLGAPPLVVPHGVHSARFDALVPRPVAFGTTIGPGVYDSDETFTGFLYSRPDRKDLYAPWEVELLFQLQAEGNRPGSCARMVAGL